MDNEKRKIIVGLSGIDQRDERLIEIVFRHSQYNPVEFELQQRLDLKRCEILLVNPMTPEGLKALARLRTASMQLPVVSVVPRGASPGSRYAIALDRLTLQLLPMLNRVVSEQCGPDGFESRGDLIVARVAPRDQEGGAAKPETSLAQATGLAASPAIAVAATPVGPDVEATVAENAAKFALTPEAGALALPALSLDLAHVLIVDQSFSARQQLSRAVESLGMLCTTAQSGEEALALCQNSRFDLAFVEIVLPGMNGFRLTREVRQLYPDMPVVILSCKASPLDLLRGAMAGSSKYLAKPVKMFWFRKALEEGLRRSKSGRYNEGALLPLADKLDDACAIAADTAGLPVARETGRKVESLATTV